MSKFSGPHSTFTQDFNARIIPLTTKLKKVEAKKPEGAKSSIKRTPQGGVKLPFD